MKGLKKITIDELSSFPALENLSGEEAIKVIDTFVQFSLITYNAFRKEENDKGLMHIKNG